jgi:hypothetical protein
MQPKITGKSRCMLLEQVKLNIHWLLLFVLLAIPLGCKDKGSEDNVEISKLNQQATAFWNKMYSGTEYIYGEAPNDYFADYMNKQKPGRILLPAEGEGRNAVFAAQKGWQVDAFDISRMGQQKALALATLKKVKIKYVIADFAKPPVEPGSYDLVAMIYAHMPKSVRRSGMPDILQSVKSGGTILYEVFSPAHTKTGSKFGPKDANMTIGLDELKATFTDWDIKTAEETKIQLNHGKHKGSGIVTRFIAVKK